MPSPRRPLPPERAGHQDVLEERGSTQGQTGEARTRSASAGAALPSPLPPDAQTAGDVLRPDSGLTSDLPAGLATPARRALATAGYTRLEQLAQASEDDVGRIHGIGPKAIRQLRAALAAADLSFAAKG